MDIVEVISWNDFGESHYVGPIEGSQPMSQAWVDGNDHTGAHLLVYKSAIADLPTLGWLSLTSYYASAFKTGTYPTPSKDQIVMWSRPHPASASASNDAVGQPLNSQIVCALLISTGSYSNFDNSRLKTRFGL